MIDEIMQGFSENKALAVVAILVLIDIILIIARFFYGLYSFRKASKQYAQEMIHSEERMKAVIGNLNDQHTEFAKQVTDLQETMENESEQSESNGPNPTI